MNYKDMNIYRISQAPNNQAQMQEVMEAITNINASVAAINDALQTLEQTGVLELFQRENLINAIQSGNLTGLDINNINQALASMSTIARSVPVINESIRIIQTNADLAQAINMDLSSIESIMIKSLQTGDYQQFQSMLSGFKQSLPSTSNTQM